MQLLNRKKKVELQLCSSTAGRRRWSCVAAQLHNTKTKVELCYSIAPQHEEEGDDSCRCLLHCPATALQRSIAKKNKKKATAATPSPSSLRCSAAKKTKEEGDGAVAFFVALQQRRKKKHKKVTATTLPSPSSQHCSVAQQKKHKKATTLLPSPSSLRCATKKQKKKATATTLPLPSFFVFFATQRRRRRRRRCCRRLLRGATL